MILPLHCELRYHMVLDKSTSLPGKESQKREFKKVYFPSLNITVTRLTLLYKTSRRQIGIDVKTYLQFHSEFRIGCRYRQVKTTKNIYFNSFFPRNIRLWNRLPEENVESNFSGIFESKLLSFLAEK